MCPNILFKSPTIHTILFISHQILNCQFLIVLYQYQPTLGSQTKSREPILTCFLYCFNSRFEYFMIQLQKSFQLIIDLFSCLRRRYGVAGLYKGMEAKVLQTILTAALMFAVYEKIAHFVFKVMLSQKSSQQAQLS